MNIHAEDKISKKNSKITITNEKGRLSKDDIDKLVKDAEKYKGEDELMKTKIEAKGALEQTNYSMRNALNDESLKDKFTAEEKTSLTAVVEETQKWIEANPNAETEDYKKKLKEVEEIFNPHMAKF